MKEPKSKTKQAHQKVTIYQVAQEAGVTISTVSRAFSRPELIGTKTRDRIIEVSRRLNYRPSAFAGSLTTNRTLLIGLVTADIRNPTVASLTRGFQDTIRPRRYLPIICSTGSDPELEISMIDELYQRGIDGLVVTSSYGWMAKEVLTYFNKQSAHPLPLVFIGQPVGMPDVDTVGLDSVNGTRMAIEHLIELGHRHIGCLSGRLAQGVAPRRWQAYLDTMAAHGLSVKPEWVAEEETTFEGGTAAMRRILSRGQPPTAMFAINDLLAFGAMDACRKVGLSVPDDISFIGFDDMPAASMLSPMLSTISQPSFQQGEAAANFLLNRIDDNTIEKQTIEMPCKLVVRETTSAPARRD